MPTSSPRRDRLVPGAAALGAGVLTALSLPPWGWWPLTFVGLVVLDRLIAGQPAAVRFRRGALFGAGWLYPGMAWMWFLSVPGYLVAGALHSCGTGAVCALVPRSRWRWLALPGAFVVVETVRWSWPFGGVPLASLAIAQVGGPLAPVARIGGGLLLSGVVVAVAVALGALVARAWKQALAVAVVVALVVGLAHAAPDGERSGALRVALVQGGGQQGTRAKGSDRRVVFERHLAASELVEGPVDLVVWPENVVHVEGELAAAPEAAELADLARRLRSTLVVGLVESFDDIGRFTNQAVAYGPDGTIVDRYDKVRRVPFGEYMPLRGLLSALGAPTDLVPNDAVAGTGPAKLDTPVGRLAVVISWEVFFGGRAREGTAIGGGVLLNPTNGASYRGTILQTQQVASSRLRAIETGRWVLQVAPTGLSAIVSPGGEVVQRSSVSEQAVLQGVVEVRSGRTAYSHLGDRPVFAFGLALVAAAWLAERRRRPAAERADRAERAERAGRAGRLRSATTAWVPSHDE